MSRCKKSSAKYYNFSKICSIDYLVPIHGISDTTYSDQLTYVDVFRQVAEKTVEFVDGVHLLPK